jgi:hypothetical protein
MRGRSRPPRSPALLAAIIALAAPAAARANDAGSVEKSSGAVQATLSWDAAEYGIANPHLKITRAGVVAYDVSLADVCPEGCILVPDQPGQPSVLQVVDLDRDHEPEVLVDTYSGGAHCCLATRIYDYRPASAMYGRTSVRWGNGDYSLKDLGHDHKLEFVGQDDVFAYAFSSYADSAFPPLILRFRHAHGRARVDDVTSDFPARVRSDARRLLRVIRRAKAGESDVRGVLAAYVADEFMLRKGRVGLREVARAQHRKLLDGDHAWPYGSHYRRALLKFLRKNGYR